MDSNNSESGNEPERTIIGRLLEKATDSLVISVLRAFDPFKSRTVNSQALNSTRFQIKSLEACAEFLSISLTNKDNLKIYTKTTLSTRIAMGLFALLPAKCGECQETYSIPHDSTLASTPLFTCFRCFQGAHSCEANRLFHQTISQANVSTGFVWLCDDCLQNPAAPRRDRARLNKTKSLDTDSQPRSRNDSVISALDSGKVLQTVKKWRKKVEDHKQPLLSKSETWKYVQKIGNYVFIIMF